MDRPWGRAKRSSWESAPVGLNSRNVCSEIDALVSVKSQDAQIEKPTGLSESSVWRHRSKACLTTLPIQAFTWKKLHKSKVLHSKIDKIVCNSLLLHACHKCSKIFKFQEATRGQHTMEMSNQNCMPQMVLSSDRVEPNYDEMVAQMIPQIPIIQIIAIRCI
eukprot:s2505_g8.t1